MKNVYSLYYIKLSSLIQTVLVDSVMVWHELKYVLFLRH